MTDDVSTTSHTPHVLIVGGGIGGLCLAQGLQRAGVQLAVFDRATSPVPDHQGYGFTINADGDNALRACLPTHLFELYRATSSPPPTGDFVLFTAAGKVVFRKPLPATSGVTVNRQTLREILLSGLGDMVRFGKRYLRYETGPGDLIDAHFADGTRESGRLLVGADGVNSAVRSQLVPDAKFDDYGVSIYGKTPLTVELQAAVPPEFLTGMSRAKDRQGVTLGVGTFAKEESFEHAVARLAPDVRLSPVSDYLRWTLSLSDALRDDPAIRRRLLEARPPETHQFAIDLVADWHPALRVLVEKADASATFSFGIFAARPVQRWDEPAITLLGDAIHAMTPGRGEGANIALRDAALLAAVLSDANAGRTSLHAAKSRYETEMLRYGFQSAEDSRKPFFADAIRRSL